MDGTKVYVAMRQERSETAEILGTFFDYEPARGRCAEDAKTGGCHLPKWEHWPSDFGYEEDQHPRAVSRAQPVDVEGQPKTRTLGILVIYEIVESELR